MQKLTLLTSSILAATLTLTGCGGGGGSSSDSAPSKPVAPPVTTIPPVDDKPAPIVKNTLNGIITDINNNPLANAAVTLGNSTIITNQTGTYTFNLNSALKNNIDVSTVIIKKPGYLTTIREIPFVSNQAYKLDIALAADQISTVFETSTSFNQNFISSNATISLSFNSTVNSAGQPYNGSATLAASYYSADSARNTRAFTQPFSGQSQDGLSTTELANVGIIEVKLTDATGKSLTLAENRKLTLVFPGASTDLNLETIPLWYYDEEKAIWIEEGVAERQVDDSNEVIYIAEVSRLGLWTLSVPLNQHSALIEGCVVDSETNKPTSSSKLLVGGRGFETYSRSDNDGKFSIAVPINTPLLLSPVKHQSDFRETRIPALSRNEVYKIDNDQCIVISKNNGQGLIDLNVELNAFFSQLGTLPAIIKPVTTSSAFQPPLTIIERANVNVVGYQFDLVDESAVTDIILKDLQTYKAPNNSNFDSATYILQSLYGDNNEYLEKYKFWSKTIMTSQGTFDSSAQGGRYRGPYLENSSTMGPEIAAIIQYDATFSNNQLIRKHNNNLTLTNSYRDQSLTNQKIADVLFYGAPKTPTNTSIINNLNRLPTSISTFDDATNCKILTARTTNADYIEYVSISGSKRNNYANINPPLVNIITGSWYPNLFARWTAEEATNSAGVSRAVVNYDDGTYEDGIYVRANTLKVSPTEKQQCNIYNEAAKTQILEALSKVTLPSQ